MRLIWASIAALAASPAWGAVSIEPAYVQLQPGGSVQFAAGGGAVRFQVNSVTGGGAAGTITAGGLFTAGATLPNPAALVITAVSATDPTDFATATVTLLAAPPAGTTYYVAPGGSDAAPGTQPAPFATLQHAADVAAAGDTVLVRQGIYNARMVLTHSGNTARGPITFAAYPGEQAVIDGTLLPVPGGQNGLVTLTDVSNVIVQGFELRNYTTASRSQVPIGIYISGAGAGVQIVNNHIHDITTTATTTPVKCGSDALGLAAYGSHAPAAIAALVVTGNELDHLKTGCSESVSLDGNVDGFLVAGNKVHDNDNIGIDASGYEKVSPDPAYDQPRNGAIRGNLVYNITSYGNPDYGKQYAADGLYVDGGTQILIEQNIVHDTDLAIELASEHKGRLTSFVTARNNLIYANNANGISIGGYGKPRGGTDHCTIVNNTLFGNDTKLTGSGEFQIQWHATNNLFANNIVQAGKQALVVHNFTPSSAAAASLDHNLYFAPAGAIFQWNKLRYKGFAAYQAATGQDAASLFTDPLFAANFDIQPTSPARNAGANLGAAIVGTADLTGAPRQTGNAISIGAYQN